MVTGTRHSPARMIVLSYGRIWVAIERVAPLPCSLVRKEQVRTIMRGSSALRQVGSGSSGDLVGIRCGRWRGSKRAQADFHHRDRSRRTRKPNPVLSSRKSSDGYTRHLKSKRPSLKSWHNLKQPLRGASCNLLPTSTHMSHTVCTHHALPQSPRVRVSTLHVPSARCRGHAKIPTGGSSSGEVVVSRRRRPQREESSSDLVQSHAGSKPMAINFGNQHDHHWRS